MIERKYSVVLLDSAISFLRQVRSETGDSELAYRMMDVIDENFKHEVMDHLMFGDVKFSRTMTLRHHGGIDKNKIGGIKLIRAISGMGLKQAKECIEVLDEKAYTSFNGDCADSDFIRYREEFMAYGYILD